MWELNKDERAEREEYISETLSNISFDEEFFELINRPEYENIDKDMLEEIVECKKNGLNNKGVEYILEMIRKNLIYWTEDVTVVCDTLLLAPKNVVENYVPGLIENGYGHKIDLIPLILSGKVSDENLKVLATHAPASDDLITNLSLAANSLTAENLDYLCDFKDRDAVYQVKNILWKAERGYLRKVLEKDIGDGYTLSAGEDRSFDYHIIRDTRNRYVRNIYSVVKTYNREGLFKRLDYLKDCPAEYLSREDLNLLTEAIENFAGDKEFSDLTAYIDYKAHNIEKKDIEKKSGLKDVNKLLKEAKEKTAGNNSDHSVRDDTVRD